MILLIGYGNELCGDDGLGPWAAQQLAGAGPYPNFETLALRQLTPELAEPISRASAVIFVDAAEGSPAGQIDCRELSPTRGAQGAFTHHAGPEELLESARYLYGHCPPAWLYTVNGVSFDLGAPFSAPVRHAMLPLLEQLNARLAGERI